MSTLKKLNKKRLDSGEITIAYNKNAAELPEKILQFGEGNFLRAFINWMVDEMNGAGVFNGRAVLVQPLENGLIEMLNQQDGLYTLMQRGILNNEKIDTKKIITSVARAINPYAEWDTYLQSAHNPDMELIVSNTTEAGIAFDEEEKKGSGCPQNFPAKLTLWLLERFKAFGGARDKGMIIMPCELINYNGAKLKECVEHYIELWKLEEGFKAWLDNSCTFLSTLVDRIVPGYPREEIDTITAELGYRDNLVVTGEIFHLLVVQGASEAVQQKLPFCKANLNVIFTDDLQSYRTRKVALLNGAHTGSVLGAYLGGLDTVGEMLNDADFSQFLKCMIFDEIVPALDLPEEEKKSYAEAVLERFANPFVRHELLSISLNSVVKWKVRVMPSLKKYIEINSEVPKRLAFSLAALIAFYKGSCSADHVYTGTRGDETYIINDSNEIKLFFATAWECNDLNAIVHKVLSNVAFWDEDLTAYNGLLDAVCESLEAITTHGVRTSIGALI